MKGNIIKIPAINYGTVSTNQNILMALSGIANEYRFYLRDPNKHLGSLIEEYVKNTEESDKEIKLRKDEWKKVLGRYYKMTYEKETNNRLYKGISYIFPYRVIDSNNALCLLEIKEDDAYDGCVKEKIYKIDEDWNYDIYLEEIREDEFRDKAIKTANYIIDTRLRKIKESKIEH